MIHNEELSPTRAENNYLNIKYYSRFTEMYYYQSFIKPIILLPVHCDRELPVFDREINFGKYNKEYIDLFWDEEMDEKT